MVDLQLADINGLSLLDLDDLGVSFKRDVPKCVRLAIVMAPKAGNSRYTHLANAHSICGVETELFEDMEAAKFWLLKED